MINFALIPSTFNQMFLSPFIILAPVVAFAKTLWHFPPQADTFYAWLFSILIFTNFSSFTFYSQQDSAHYSGLFYLLLWLFSIFIQSNKILPISLDEWNSRLLKLSGKEAGANGAVLGNIMSLLIFNKLEKKAKSVTKKNCYEFCYWCGRVWSL